MQDITTKKYFNKYLPEYSRERFAKFFKYLENKHGSLLEVGSSSGALIEEISSKFKIDPYGLEYATSYKKKMTPELIRRTYFGSILDDKFVSKLGKKFDFIVLPHTIHHLTSLSIVGSRKLAITSILNCKRLLKPDGRIIIIEPSYEPKFLVTILFYVKRFFSKLTTRRIGIFGYWNNIGPPVVKYYTIQELADLLKHVGLEIEIEEYEPSAIGLIRRIFLFKKFDCFIVSRVKRSKSDG